MNIPMTTKMMFYDEDILDLGDDLFKNISDNDVRQRSKDLGSKRRDLLNLYGKCSWPRENLGSQNIFYIVFIS